MTAPLDGDQVPRSRWQWVALQDIVIGTRQRGVSPGHVARLQASYERLGVGVQLQPVVLDEQLHLIDGAHRVEAAKGAGWQVIGAIVLVGVDPSQRTLLEIEANLVRKSLTLREREAAWSDHYEPLFRAQADRRKRAALRRGVEEGRGHGANSEESRAPTLAQAAKHTIGLSIDTLKKIAEIRDFATSAQHPDALRETAAKALERLDQPGASVSALHQQVRSARDRLCESGERDDRSPTAACIRALERTVGEVTHLATRLDGTLAVTLSRAIKAEPGQAEHLRALRVALARSLAIVVAVECGFDAHPVAALRSLGHEVGQLLSSTSVQQLRKQGDLV